jgi:hypothetical protein
MVKEGYISIRYKNITVKVKGIKPTICSCCKKETKPRGLGAHHTKYAYSVDEVRANPELAKDNTIYLCFHCHRVGNSIRILNENKEKTIKLINLGVDTFFTLL